MPEGLAQASPAYLYAGRPMKLSKTKKIRQMLAICDVKARAASEAACRHTTSRNDLLEHILKVLDRKGFSIGAKVVCVKHNGNRAKGKIARINVWLGDNEFKVAVFVKMQDAIKELDPWALPFHLHNVYLASDPVLKTPVAWSRSDSN